MTQPIENGADNRSLVVRLRVNKAEKQKIEQFSAEAGLSLSDWIRSRAIDVRPLFRKPNPDREVLLKLLSELGKIGSNCNQIARHLHRKDGNFTLPLEVITQAMEGIKTLTAHLRKILERGQ